MSGKGTGLAGRLTAYGDEGFAKFLRETFLLARGYGADDLDRPVVAICDTGSDFNPCHATAPQLVEAISRGVSMAGGLPLVFPTISLHESFAHPTSMFLRNLMSMDTEEMLKALPLDSAVLIGGCDKTIPAQLMGAISADVPTLSVTVGPMLTGSNEGTRLGACTDCRRLWTEHRAGAMSDTELRTAQSQLMASHGTCMVMGTASTMACIAETLGFMLPGGASIPAVHSERLRHAEASGRRAVEMARGAGPLPSSLVTKASARNAAVALQALGGSTNVTIHLAAILGRAGVTLDLEELDEIGRKTPILCDLKPVGRLYMQDFHAAGGFPALLRELAEAGHFDADTTSADGRQWSEVLDDWPAWSDTTIIRKAADPVVEGSAIAVLRGSLVPGGAILKQAAMSAHLRQHEGPALVFDGLEDLAARIDDPDLEVTPDHVLVLRNIGPVGAPGMPEAGSIPIPLKLAREGVRDMVRISDARMSGTAYGAVVLHASPEAAVGGPLALVRDGDRIRLDTEARMLDLLVDEDELERRRAEWSAPEVPARGYAKLFVESVQQAEHGCDFDFLVGTDGARDE
ncbi:dihydroxy-acid dehydratase [Pelagovum pacificum]|uniref:Dihydroxy-acid dehydratase n=1 Tax=Pelagovum pacificum TaxID=2588711 RepID=A0A5C5G9G0_9RHOB|nr:dihydroxy-acid dehydratase [Pelagovum pacificum]QQA41942.1 dihydroxy-acid dehydratase [Pelagovum pacificum]TNY30618.1 dihydroxy-acid dehydratase [Pelagovum pacificum]